MTSKSIALVALTPLEGMSAVVQGFLKPEMEAAGGKIQDPLNWL
jgi:hypothetical protein